MKYEQVPLFEKSYFEIKKHSSIVQMSNIATLQERKVMNALLWIAKDTLKRSPDDRVFNTEVGTLKRLTGLKQNDNLELKDALRNLANMAIEYNIMHKDDANERGIFRFISEVKIKEEWIGKSTNIIFEFPTSILETIKNPNMFVTLDLMIIRSLESKHSIVLYEFIKDYLKLWKLRCIISDFRKLMWIQDNQYKNFAMFRKRALDVAINEINEQTDIIVSYTLEKFWKQVSAILFTMQPKKNIIKEDKLEINIKTKLKLYGVSDPIIETLIQKHDLEYLSANLKIVEEQIKKGGITNITWYLLKSFKIDYRQEETPFEIEKKKKKEQQKLDAIKQREDEKINEELKKEQQRIMLEQAQIYLDNLSETETKELRDIFISEKLNNLIFARLYNQFGADNPVIQSEWLKYVAENKIL